MLLFAKQGVIEVGLPDHVVRMYLEQSADRLTARMRSIMSQPATQPATSTGLDETLHHWTVEKKRMEGTRRRRRSEKNVSENHGHHE